jgi:hypothetical protein
MRWPITGIPPGWDRAMNDNAFLAVFPFLFIGMWLLITTTLGHFAGWSALRQRFPDRDEAPLRRMHFQSASLGKGSSWNPWGGVSYSSCLRFDICQTGLRVAIYRLFNPFEGPFLVPWSAIAVEEKRILFLRVYRLSFGNPDLRP